MGVLSGTLRPMAFKNVKKPLFSAFSCVFYGTAVKTIPKNPVATPLISQIVRSGTSVGANYCEADDAVSKKDFKNKIGTCRKEARETKLWLRMIAAAEPELKAEARKLWQEAKELHLIFAAIWRKS